LTVEYAGWPNLTGLFVGILASPQADYVGHRAENVLEQAFAVSRLRSSAGHRAWNLSNIDRMILSFARPRHARIVTSDAGLHLAARALRVEVDWIPRA
jgi:hypothetical protein